MIIFFSIFFTLYGALNYYIFIRGWQALAAYPVLKPFYLAIFIISASGYVLAKAASDYLPDFLYDTLLWVGSFWFSFMVYFFLSVILIDLLRLLNWKLDFFPAAVKNNYELTKQLVFIIVLVLTTIINILGFINTRNIVVREFAITLPKGNSNLNELNAVVVSDFHLSPLNNKKLLGRMIEKINSVNPDIVLMPGDIVDDKARVLRRHNIGSSFKDIKSKYGVYASNGNHEFITGIDESVEYMRDMDIKVIRDSSVLIDGSFYVIGRDDRSGKGFTGKERKSLEEIMRGVDKSYPSFLLDHTPLNLEEAENNNISLQLSGHTHHGQIFPGNLITSSIYEVSWGFLRKGNTQYYVTCGIGTWGPPVRIGSVSEVVNLKIKFE